jgi:transcriptional regulator with XRE-family HTH domain
VSPLLSGMRENTGYTQTELAKRLNIKQSGMSRWENRSQMGYTIRKPNEIADACGYDLEVTFKPRDIG